MVAAADFWPTFMANEAANAACRYVATRGGAALGGFVGGTAGSLFTPAGTVIGAGGGSVIGGAAGAALGALYCPDEPPSVGEFPLLPAQGLCPGVQYELDYLINCTFDPASGSPNQNYQGLYRATVIGPVTNYEPVLPGTLVGGLAGQNALPPVSIRDLTTGNTFGMQRVTSIPQLTKTPGSNQALTLERVESITRTDGQPDACPENAIQIPAGGTDVPLIQNDVNAVTFIDTTIEYTDGTSVVVQGDLNLLGTTLRDNELVLQFNFDGLDFTFNPLNFNVNIGRGREWPPTDNQPENYAWFELLIGINYNVVVEPDFSKTQFVNGGKYHIPRCGSIRFTGNGKQSEEFECHGDEGFIPNPNRRLFTDFVLTNQTGYTLSASKETELLPIDDEATWAI